MTAAETEVRECIRLARESLGMGPANYSEGTELNGLVYLLAHIKKDRLPADLVARSQVAVDALRAERGR